MSRCVAGTRAMIRVRDFIRTEKLRSVVLYEGAAALYRHIQSGVGPGFDPPDHDDFFINCESF